MIHTTTGNHAEVLIWGREWCRLLQDSVVHRLAMTSPCQWEAGCFHPSLHSAVGSEGILPGSGSSQRQCLQSEFRRQFTLPDGSPVEQISQGIQCGPSVQCDREPFSSFHDVFLFIVSVDENFQAADAPQTLLHLMQHGLLILVEEL